MQKLIHKNLKLDGIMDTLSYIHSKGIFITASFIFGFPEENEEDISHTISTIGKIMRLKDSVAQTHLCTFLPGTELTRRYRDQLTMSSIPSDVTDDIGLHECRDIINNHPALFPQFLEYTTPLRTELQFLPAFVYMWRNFQPVFQYISEKYEHTRLIEMYRDFARENLPILEQYEDIEDEEKFHALLQHDRFLYLFKQDENYDLITDFRRIKLIESCKEVKNGSSVTDIFCFSPAQIQQGSRLQDYTRGIYAVTYSKNPDDTLNIRIRSMQKR